MGPSGRDSKPHSVLTAMFVVLKWLIISAWATGAEVDKMTARIIMPVNEELIPRWRDLDMGMPGLRVGFMFPVRPHCLL